ncbi:hypothetical protein M2271_006500 [Streptomyces sp. LBL]|uniref:hypothetical protein n=1 Tax=Streptomyces sp. LBL TaxID=2940562 RepID=UPI002476038F|nr:hypothetical protein [Streptomyces sp. LBL]MDH6628667.1 hypothetical protein [Streptomyces sp. LBL]
MSSFNLDEREKRKQFASYFKELEDRIANLERANQLNNASIEGGALDIYDDDGLLKGSVGVQGDGTVALVPEPQNTDPPPTPAAPTVDSALAGLDITWSGQWADSEASPADFSLVQVHVGTPADFTPNAATQVSQINDVTGGKTTVHIEGYDPVWVRLVAVNTAALTGDPSDAVQGQARQAVGQDLVDEMITEVKLAQNAVTTAKIALGAVGTTTLADDAITTPKILAGAVTTDKLVALAVTAEKIASLAITTDKLAALSITADKLAVNSVTATAIAAGVINATHIKAGAITADRLAIVGGNNMLPDPSFEGPGGAALVAGQTFWTITNAGNGSSKSVQVNAVNPNAVIRTLTLATFSILPGQQLRLATDVNPSTDWNGNSVRIYARWFDSAGGVLFGFVTNTTPAKGAWSTMAGVVTAPPGTVAVEIRLATYDSNAGTVMFDNSVIQPVLGQVQIADGAITADKLDADAINGKTITGSTVQSASGGHRIVMAPSGILYFYTGAANEYSPGRIEPKGSDTSLSIWGPQTDSAVDYGLVLKRIGASTSAVLNTDSTTFVGDVKVAGQFSAKNMAWGSVSITPSANADSSVTITGVGLVDASSYRVFLTINSGLPSVLRTPTATDATADGFTLWLNRSTATATNVWWFMIAK